MDVLHLRDIVAAKRDAAYVWCTEPRKLVGAMVKNSDSVHFPEQSPHGNLNIGLFKAPRGSAVVADMRDRCLALVNSRRALQPLSFTNIFIERLREDRAAMGEFVLPPLAAMPLAAFTPNCGCTAYGYEIPSLVEIARSGYCVHFLGGKTKKRFSEYSTKLLQMVPNQ